MIRGLEVREIIPFPVWIIPFPDSKTGFDSWDLMGNHIQCGGNSPPKFYFVWLGVVAIGNCFDISWIGICFYFSQNNSSKKLQMPSVKWDMSAHSHVRNISGVRDKCRRLRFSMGGVQLDFSVLIWCWRIETASLSLYFSKSLFLILFQMLLADEMDKYLC